MEEKEENREEGVVGYGERNREKSGFGYLTKHLGEGVGSRPTVK